MRFLLFFLIPGLSSIQGHRPLTGLLHFTAFAVALNLAVILPYLTDPWPARPFLFVAAALLWFTHFWSARRRVLSPPPAPSPRAPEKVYERR